MTAQKKGKLIVIEGTDGSGKSVQTRLLAEKLKKEGRRIIAASFPQYGKKSTGLIEEYLNGKYGAPGAVSPYAASLFYALDRFDFSYELKKFLAEGLDVVLDRYVDSNAGHQGGKITNLKEREKFLSWLYDLEYRILGIPRPDVVLFLHVSAEIGQKLVAKKQQRLYLERGKTHDVNEGDIGHLKAAEESYLFLVKKYPKEHHMIECVRNGNLAAPDEIAAMVWSLVKKYV